MKNMEVWYVVQERKSYLEIVKSAFMSKDTFPTFILIANVFSWYFPLYIFLRNILTTTMSYENLLMIFGIHYLAVLFSAVAGIALFRKFLSRNRLLSLWMLLGACFSFFMILLKTESVLIISIVSVLIGVVLGFGYPSCLAYFADSIDTENKGKLGGIMFFTAFLGMLLIGFFTSILGFVESVLIYTLWRALGFIAFYTLKDRKSKGKERSAETSYKLIISEKPFILYMVPWTMFCLVNFFVGPLQEHYWNANIFNSVIVAEFGIASIATLIGGYFADLIGRKRVVISGYVLLGIGYAVLSIFPTDNIFIGIYAVFDGIAWGLFLLIFLLVIWGDLAGDREKEKYYLLGALPFLISSYIWIIVAPFAEVIPISASFSLASFFLFLAVVPLMFAPETLSEKAIRERELRSYIEKAKRVREKFTKG